MSHVQQGSYTCEHYHILHGRSERFQEARYNRTGIDIIDIPIYTKNCGTKNWPGNEENLALLAVLLGDKVKIIDGISTIVFRQSSHKVIITLSWASSLLHNNLLSLLIDFEDHITVHLLSLELQICMLALVSNAHPRRCIGLKLNTMVRYVSSQFIGCSD